MDQYRNYIDGAWASSHASTRNINPSNTDDVIGLFASGTSDDAASAIAAARAALPAWARSSIQQRHDILRKAADEILARREELGRALSREEGKTLPEGVAEATRAGQIFAFFAAECLRTDGELLSSVRSGISVEITHEPIGPIAIITPWNFPIAIPAWKIAPALAYGNTVVFKPAELVSHSAWLLVDILNRAGLPNGVLNLVMGKGSVVGQAMLESPAIAGVSFTGSTATGRRLAMTAVGASPMKKLQLEMGGKNPLVVLDDADLETALNCAINGAYFSTGQRCTASSRLIVTEGIHKRFVDGLTPRLAALTVGDALKDGVQIGPVVDAAQLEQDERYIAIGRAEGARLHWGGDRLTRDTPGFFLQPALFTDVDPAMRIAREEIFGPVAVVIPAKNYDHALALANDTEFGLTAGICTTSLKTAAHFKRNAEAGMVMVNLPTAGVDYHVPFGGRKSSSYGPREQGRHAREFYTTTKTAYVDPS